MKDHEWSDEPICPHCGHKFKDAWEWSDSGEHECCECGKLFFYERTLYVRWTTKTLAILILLVLTLNAQVIPLGVVNEWRGIAIPKPQRPDIEALELHFTCTNRQDGGVSLISTNEVIRVEEIPADVLDGRHLVAMRWLAANGVKSAFTVYSIDLQRTAPEPPQAHPIMIGGIPKAALKAESDPKAAIQRATYKALPEPPPLPPSTGGMQRAFIADTNAMRKFFQQGGQKGRVRQ